MPGPIPTIALGPFRGPTPIETRPLKCLAKIASPARAVVEEKAWSIFESYLEFLAAAKASPREDEIKAAVEKRLEEMGRVILFLSDPLPKPAHDGTRPHQIVEQFRGVLADLLEKEGSSMSTFLELAEKALVGAREFDRTLTVLLAAIERGVKDGSFEKVSERDLRHRMIISLHRMLVAEINDAGTGFNSVLLSLVEELEDRQRPDDFDLSTYRKGLARQIALAVKCHKGE